MKKIVSVLVLVMMVTAMLPVSFFTVAAQEDEANTTIEAFKFYDANLNGIWDQGEDPIAGFKFQLVDANGNVINENFTGPDGVATFEIGYGTGPYSVREVLPSGGKWFKTGERKLGFDGGLVEMYASAYTSGPTVPVNFDSYNPALHPARLNPGNVLGAFDAYQSSPDPSQPYNVNDYFFALASREWTTYTFDNDFWNVNGYPDIEFSEVTWGSWHTEAALVFLTNAYVLDGEGNVVPYGGNDGGFGYFAGIVWNKIGILGLTPAEMESKAQDYASVMGITTRNFEHNTFSQNGNFGISQFYLPDEVVYASGITLVDITDDVYGMVSGSIGPYGYPNNNDISGVPGTYENGGGTNDGYSVYLNEAFGAPIGSDDVTAVYGTDGNTDGYDLDAIRVYMPQVTRIEFGNVCLEQGSGGKTIGFWSNKNGQALINSSDITALNGLNLYKPNGWKYPPFSGTLSTAKTQIKSYLLSATAKDMRWMLSAQLIATVLNAQKGFLSNSTIVYVGPSAYVPTGFISISGVIENANAALLGTKSAQAYWKDVCDGLNNNWYKFVCPGPCYPIY